MTVKAFAVSDVGRRRETNEDSFLLDQGQGLFAVADGMGGHAAGEVASRLAIDTLKEALQRDTPARSLGTTDDAGNWLRDAVVEANRRIWDSIRVHEERRGMGTTVVVLLRAGDDAVIGHVGDSRIYLLRGGTLHRMTSDHSWVNEQVKLGLLSDDEAQRHPMRNIVTRALGNRPALDVDISEAEARPDDVFLLCSDGLNSMLTDSEIHRALSRHGRDPEGACRELVALANSKGGEDNITVIVCVVCEESSENEA